MSFSPIILCQALLSEALLDLCLEIFGNDEVGGEAEGGSNKSDKSEADPGLKGDSTSISMGDPPELLCWRWAGGCWGWDLNSNFKTNPL